MERRLTEEKARMFNWSHLLDTGVPVSTMGKPTEYCRNTRERLLQTLGCIHMKYLSEKLVQDRR